MIHSEYTYSDTQESYVPPVQGFTMNIIKFDNDKQGADADGNLRLIPAGQYRYWEEGGYCWIEYNTEFLRYKKVDEPLSEWYHWGKYDVSDSPGLSLVEPSLLKRLKWVLIAIAAYLIFNKK
jgi:hypothetical protein